MPILIYLTVTLIVCIMASIPVKSNKHPASGAYAAIPGPAQVPVNSQRNKAVTGKKMQWFILITIAMILSIYSKTLGLSAGLTDRVTYSFSFLYRYPVYYSSLHSLINSGTEPGIVVLSMLIAKFTGNVTWLFFIATFLTSVINLYVLYKMTDHFLSGTALFMLSLFFFDGTYLVKQSLAIALANLAILSYINRKSVNYFLFTAAACLFHSTAVILFPLYFLFKVVRTKKAYFLMFIIFGILFLFFGIILTRLIPSLPFVNHYIDAGEYEYYFGGGSTTSVIKGIPFYITTALALIFREEMKKELKNADVYIISSFIYSASWLFTFNMYWFFRVGWYLMLPTLIMIPALFRCIRGSRAYLFLESVSMLFMILITLRQICIILL